MSSACSAIVLATVAVGCLLLVPSPASALLPPTITTCPSNSTDLDQCIIDVVNELRPVLASGDFGDNYTVPTLEPIVIDRLTIDRGENFRANFTNFRISGVTHDRTGFVVKKLKTDVKGRKINVTLLLPKLQVNSKYSLLMSLLVLRINGNGDLQVNLTDTRASLKLSFYTEIIDGSEYFRFHPIVFRLKFGKARFYLKNLFNGDPALEAVGNQAINENPDVLLEEVRAGIEENLGYRFTEIAQFIVRDALLEEVFP